MIKTPAILSLLILIISMRGYCQVDKVFGNYMPLQKGDTVYCFEPCWLKAKPDVKASNLTKVHLGELLVIDSVYYATQVDQELRPSFYRVKYQKHLGFITPNYVSIGKLVTRFPDEYFLVNQWLFSDTAANELKWCFIKNGRIEHCYFQKLIGNAYSISLTNHRGLADISHLIQINYYAEACGEEGGISYLTWDNTELNELISLSSISEAGLYFATETLIFPTDSGGIPGKLIYQVESGESVDEASNWWRTTKEVREHQWVNKTVYPAFRSKNAEQP